jgi:hypothetical protein
MAHTKHENLLVDLDKPYEGNVIGVKGIAYFTIFLVLLIVVTFGLMWVLLHYVLEEDARINKSSDNPMMMSERDRLPPEPRLQGAPGFGVTGPNGAVNLELREPQAEYRELKKIWDEQVKNGQKDKATGTVIAMPVDAAIEKLIAQPIKAKSGADAEKVAMNSRLYPSDSSSGRNSALKRR